MYIFIVRKKPCITQVLLKAFVEPSFWLSLIVWIYSTIKNDIKNEMHAYSDLNKLLIWWACNFLGGSDSQKCKGNYPGHIMKKNEIIEKKLYCYCYFINKFEVSKIFILLFNQRCIKVSAVKWLIVINRIQNKSFCLQNMCVYCVYLLWIYKCTQMHVYIKKFTFIY